MMTAFWCLQVNGGHSPGGRPSSCGGRPAGAAPSPRSPRDAGAPLCERGAPLGEGPKPGGRRRALRLVRLCALQGHGGGSLRQSGRLGRAAPSRTWSATAPTPRWRWDAHRAARAEPEGARSPRWQERPPWRPPGAGRRPRPRGKAPQEASAGRPWPCGTSWWRQRTTASSRRAVSEHSRGRLPNKKRVVPPNPLNMG